MPSHSLHTHIFVLTELAIDIIRIHAAPLLKNDKPLSRIMNRSSKAQIPSWIITGLGMVVLALPLIVYAWRLAQRPPREPIEQTLMPGVTYRRAIQNRPRSQVIHTLKVDLTESSLRVETTPGKPSPPNQPDFPARTATEALSEFGWIVAVNASFFYPFREVTPWDFYPRSQESSIPIGLVIANGQRYALPDPKWPVLCLNGANRAIIQVLGDCAAETRQAVAGSDVLVLDGKPAGRFQGAAFSDQAYARMAIATDALGETLWIVAIDGKQPHYSEGMTLAELTQVLIDLDVDRALNLDGGGSVTLAIATPQGPKLLNSPVHSRIPLRQRPVANHLGIATRDRESTSTR